MPEREFFNPEEDRIRSDRFDQHLKELEGSKLPGSLTGLVRASRSLHYAVFPGEAFGITRVVLALHDKHVPRALKQSLRRLLRTALRDLHRRAAPTRPPGPNLFSPQEEGQIRPLYQRLLKLYQDSSERVGEDVRRLIDQSLPGRTITPNELQEIVVSPSAPFLKARATLERVFRAASRTIDKRIEKGRKKLTPAE